MLHDAVRHAGHPSGVPFFPQRGVFRHALLQDRDVLLTDTVPAVQRLWRKEPIVLVGRVRTPRSSHGICVNGGLSAVGFALFPLHGTKTNETKKTGNGVVLHWPVSRWRPAHSAPCSLRHTIKHFIIICA